VQARNKRGSARILACILSIALMQSFGGVAPAADLSRIETIVVLYPENRSFDHLYGLFPGANGLANATTEQSLQRDHDGSVLPYLSVWDRHGKPHPDFPQLPNAPFRIDAPPVSKGQDQVLLSPIHAYYHSIEQINGGRNDMFAAMSTVGGYTMGYFDGSDMKLWQWAKEFTLADNFFMGAFGGSFLNHQWLICACTPIYPDAPDSMRAILDGNGKLAKKPSSPSAREGAVQTRHSPPISRAAFRLPPMDHLISPIPKVPSALACLYRRKQTRRLVTHSRPRASTGRGMVAVGELLAQMVADRQVRNARSSIPARTVPPTSSRIINLSTTSSALLRAQPSASNI
jgi:hypothetical protein